MKIILKILFSTLIIISCSTKKVDLDSDPEILPEETKQETSNNESPFYPIKDSMEDLQYQINELKARVTEYESTLHAPSLNSEILKLIKVPQLKHEIDVDNGTMIQGTILQENSVELIVQTRIGQLRIDKAHVVNIREVEPFVPEITLNEDTIEEQISPNQLNFSGSLTNVGGRRGDFIRIIYHLWENDTKIILSDSTFINGNSVIYSNGVISDACLDPGETGTFNLLITIPDSLSVTYWTKEIRAEVFE